MPVPKNGLTGISGMCCHRANTLALRTFHYRDKEQLEVDFVLENALGEVVGIEVKAAASVQAADFRGLERLREACGREFKQGIVLYNGDNLLSFGTQQRAAPMASLWS